MNIEKSLDIIKGKLLMIDKMLKQDQEEGHGSAYEMQTEDFEAIKTLLTAYEKEKEKNKELSNSYDKLVKECNEENRRCMLLAVENQDLKEKNKKYEIQDKIKSKLDEISIEFSRILAKNNQSLETININSQRYDAMRIVLEELLEGR